MRSLFVECVAIALLASPCEASAEALSAKQQVVAEDIIGACSEVKSAPLSDLRYVAKACNNTVKKWPNLKSDKSKASVSASMILLATSSIELSASMNSISPSAKNIADMKQEAVKVGKYVSELKKFLK